MAVAPLTLEAFMALSPEKRASLKRAARSVRRVRAQLARKDPGAFNEFVLRDEQTGGPIKQAPFHTRWQEIVNDHPRVVLWSHVEGGKTNQISIGRVLWELGRNPNLRITVVSKTNDLAMKIVRAIGQYIKHSDALHEVFPDLVPADDAALPWTSHKLTVRRSVHAKDPSVQASGIYGNIHGSRIDLLILDDVIDHTNTRTATPRESLWQWVRSTLFGRLTDVARVVVMGNAWHPEDLLHRLEREPRFIGFRFPVMLPDGTLTWPEKWSRKRIDESRQDMGALEFARALLCQARDDETARFRREWIDACLVRGTNKNLCTSSIDLYEQMIAEGEIPQTDLDAMAANEALRRLGSIESSEGAYGIRFYTGVDLAVSRRDSADLTCLFTIAVLPNGDRRVLEIKSGRWNAHQILEEISGTYVRFGSVFIVENNAAQDYIVQLLQSSTAIPVQGWRTGSNKASPEFGLERIAVEMEMRKWIIPSGKDGQTRHREVDAWVGELYHYDPAAHTGDRLMASWFAQIGAEWQSRRGAGGVTVTVVGGDDDE